MSQVPADFVPDLASGTQFVDTLAGVGNLLIGDVLAPYALFSGNRRIIGSITPDIVIEEIGSDELLITEHPVETGAAISDHAFKRPPMIEMRCGFSDSTGGTGYSKQMYEEFIAVQEQREPFVVFSGKRVYKNMLIQSVTQRTDASSENALDITVILQQVIITSTQQTGGGAQADPQQTTGSTDTGSKQLGTVDNVPTFSQVSSINYSTPSAPGFGGFTTTVRGF